jgi:peptide methionine sulfoxide reductase MsrB
MKNFKNLLLVSIMILSAQIISAQKTEGEKTMANQEKSNKIKYNPLTEFETYVIENKGTERPWTGKYTDNKENGTYICKRCNTPLFKSSAKFDSHCGWPSFDDEIDGSVTRHLDADGKKN